MKITKREVIFSVVIVCLMLVFGIMISGKISDSLMNQYQEYNTALQIDNDSSLFEYGMRTNIGNAFIYGELAAVDSVTYPEIGGEYASATKVTERYTQHTRTVTKTAKRKHIRKRKHTGHGMKLIEIMFMFPQFNFLIENFRMEQLTTFQKAISQL